MRRRPCALSEPGEPESGQRLIPWLAVLAVDVQRVEDHTAGQADVVVGMAAPPRPDTPSVGCGIFYAGAALVGNLAARREREYRDSGARVIDRCPTERAEHVEVVAVVLAQLFQDRQPLKIKIQRIFAAGCNVGHDRLAARFAAHHGPMPARTLR
jgi:hypothetical protein